MINNITEIVTQTGNKLLEWRKKSYFSGTWKKNEFKADADYKAHKYIKNKLKKINPKIPIVSEEDFSLIKNNRPKIYWLIDPIDGTLSFVNGFPGFVTQIALIENNIPIMSTVFAPLFNNLYFAEHKKGAYLNEKKLIINKKNIKSIIDNTPKPRGITLEIFKHLKLKKYLESGSISLKICKIAEGAADLFVKDVTIRDWDIAAPHLILKEAGGSLVKTNNESFSYTKNYSHNGLIASLNMKHSTQISNWIKQKNSYCS